MKPCSLVALSLTLAACGKSEPAPAPTAPAPTAPAPTAPATMAPATSVATDSGPTEPAPTEPDEPEVAKGPTLTIDDEGEVTIDGVPALSKDGRTVLLFGGDRDEREGPVTVTIVLWDTLTNARDEHLVTTRPGLDGPEPTEDDKKKELASRKAAVADITKLLAATEWAPLTAGTAEYEGHDLIVRDDDKEVLREPHPEWILEDEPPCSDDPEAFSSGCGCSFPVLVSEALLDPERRLALVWIDRPIDHHCETAHPGGFWHLARVAPPAADKPDPATARWTLGETVSLLCRAPSDTLPAPVLEARRAFVLAALDRPLGRAAVWSALAACPAPAPTNAGEEATWEGALSMDKHGVGIAADGTVVLGTVDCDRADRWIETILAGPATHAARRKALNKDKADALAKPMAAVAARALVVRTGEVGEEVVSAHEVDGVSLLGMTTCALPAGKKFDEDNPASAPDFVCTTRLYARAASDKGPGGLLHTLIEDFDWDPRAVVAWTRAGAPAIVVGVVKGGDHGCGSFDLMTWDGPKDVAATLNSVAVKALKAADHPGARDGLMAALALDPTAESARYNLACAHALLGDAAASAEALGPLVAADAKDRAKWVTRVAKDKDFDRVREAPEVKALTAPTPP